MHNLHMQTIIETRYIRKVQMLTETSHLMYIQV